MSTEKHKAIIRQWVDEAWNQGNLSLASELYPDDYVLHDPAQPIHGPEGLKQFISAYRAGLPDLHFTIEDMIAEGDKVTWRFTVRGTHRGELMGIPATGKQAVVTGVVISRFANGKWQEDWVNYDLLGMLQQLGVVPALA